MGEGAVNTAQVQLPRSTTARLAATVSWFLLLGLYFFWWDLTLRAPGLLLWTSVFLGLFVATAAWLYGPALRANRDLWPRVATWAGFILAALLFVALVPSVRLAGATVPSAALVVVLDVALPLWILARVMWMLWAGVARVAALAAIPLVALLYVWSAMIQMPGPRFAGPQAPLDSTELDVARRLEHHVRVLATDIGERNDGRYAALERAARHLDSTLRALGYEVRAQEYQIGPQRFRNLEVTVPGTARSQEIVVVGGHYDSVDGTPGADDDASGVAAVLELARAFQGRRPARTVRFVLFVNEEPPWFKTPMMGSRVYADSAARRADRIVAMFSLETIGYYSDAAGSQRYPWPFSLFYPDRGNFIGFVGNLASRGLVRRSIALFRRHARIPSEGVAAPALVPGVDWSDHASFWLHGVRAVMISDTAPFRNPNYHQGQDTPEKLDYGRMARVVRGLEEVVGEIAGR